MSEWLTVLLLGFIEGLTEFIPVSSTGHLLLAKQALGLDARWDTFIVLIQLGAILAVVALYFRRLWDVVVRIPHDPAARRFVLSVAVAFFPAVIAGVVFFPIIKTVLFESPLIICVSLILGGIALLWLDRHAPQPRHVDAMRLSLGTSLGIGLFQCVSMIPGVSRSGATIAGGLLLGCDKRAAAEFSFFLAIPTMAAAFTYDLYKSRAAIDLDYAGLIVAGFVLSFITGAIVIKTMLDFVSRHGFAPFAWWRIVVGSAGLLLIAAGVW